MMKENVLGGKMMNEIDYLKNCLFRYRKIEGKQGEKNIAALKGNRLYFSTPQYFNDPYDNLMYINIKQMIEDMRVNWSLYMDGYLKGLKKRDFLMGSFGEFLWNSDKKDDLTNKYEECVNKAITNLKENVKKNLKIICFSQNVYSLLMWSHYAENHRGFALAYDKEIIKSANRYNKSGMEVSEKTIVSPVKYENERIDMTNYIHKYLNKYIFPGELDVTMIPELPQKVLREFVLTKSLEWGYEQEVRVIPRTIDISKECPLNYIECKPKAIILGSCCNDTDKQRLIKIAHEKKMHIFQAYIEDKVNWYKLNIREV